MHGNYKFRLSDMIPNAWFYKLKDMASRARATDSNNNSSSSSSSSSSSKKKKKYKTKKKPPKPQESSSSSAAASTTYPKQVPTEKVHYNPRKTHYFSRELLRDDNFSLLNVPDQPRESSKQKTSTRRTSTASAPKRVSSSSSSGCSCRTIIRTKTVGNSPPPILSSPDEGSSTITTEETEAAYSSVVFRPEIIRSDRLLLVTHSSNHMLSSSIPHPEKIESDSSSDVVIDVQPEIALPSIVTKKVTKVEGSRFSAAHLKPKLGQEIKYNRKERGIPKENTTAPSRINQRTRSASCHSPGIRLRINSPRIAASRRRSFQQVQGRRRSLSSSSSGSGSRRSLAVVKSSVDPQRDFRESMVEMIVENNLRGSKDLEELLACYLCLNADEYHDLIIKVFKQIWFDLTHQVK